MVPVTAFITEARKKCQEVRQWVEEKISKPIERWESRQEKLCKKLPWWNPLRWFCELVMVIVKVIVWVVVTVVKWVVTIVCQVVTFVVGIIIKFVLRVIGWFVSFLVCLFTDPLEALKSFRDLWPIVVDVVGEIFDFIGILIDDVIGILQDLEDLLDSLAASMGWLGVILGFVKGIVGLIRGWISVIKDAVGALGAIIQGILNLNLCDVIRGLIDLGTAIGRALLTTGFAALLVIWFPWLAAILLLVRVLGAGAGGVRDTVDRMRLEKVITDAINTAFGQGSERATRSIDSVGIGAAPMGLPFHADARRLYLGSDDREPDLRALHEAGIIDLYALAGYLSDCDGALNEPDGEVVYAGTDLRVSYADLETFLNDGPGSTPEFHVFPITRDLFRVHLETAQRKAAHLGVQLFYSIGELKATSPDHLPLNVGEERPPAGPGDAVQQSLFEQMGRTGVDDDLSRIPAISHFHYVLDSDGKELFGLASWFRPSVRDARKSGVTYRNRAPAWGFLWVLVHELGHYWGLSHTNRSGGTRSFNEIMYKKDPDVTLDVLLEYLLLGGEPRFTHDDALTTWDWITTDGAASLLP
ncbi:hypothetical protein ACFWN7_13155 [Agromyces sp. NPDC058484]|uniref:hypothetical protein n=1 Tax=Agromyces sp. NPDC058484 TaxID=3346524 RepID=UPI00366355D2